MGAVPQSDLVAPSPYFPLISFNAVSADALSFNALPSLERVKGIEPSS
jgi:hypothetical protein